MKFSLFKIQGAPWKKKLDQNMLKNIIDISLFNFFALIIMIHKYYYLFTRPSIIVVCWKSIFSSLFNFSGANNLDHFLIGGIGGRNFMLVRGENLPMKYPWEEPRGTSWKCVPPWGRKRAEPAKFCFEAVWLHFLIHCSNNRSSLNKLTFFLKYRGRSSDQKFAL